MQRSKDHRSPSEPAHLHLFRLSSPIHDLLFQWRTDFLSIPSRPIPPLLPLVCNVLILWDATLCVSCLCSMSSQLFPHSEYLMPEPKILSKASPETIEFHSPCSSDFVPGTALKRNFLCFSNESKFKFKRGARRGTNQLAFGLSTGEELPENFVFLPTPPSPTPPPHSRSLFHLKSVRGLQRKALAGSG